MKINPYALNAHPPDIHSTLMQWWVSKVRSGEMSQWCLGFQQSHTALCSCKCQECSLFASEGAAQRLQWPTLSGCCCCRTGAAMGPFVAAGVCKDNHGMGLQLRHWKRHHGALMCSVQGTLCAAVALHTYCERIGAASVFLFLSLLLQEILFNKFILIWGRRRGMYTLRGVQFIFPPVKERELLCIG